MTFSWDRNLARGTIFAPADPRDSLIGVYGTVCSLSPSLATRCNQKICRLARDINPEYFTFNCCKRRLVGMGRWVDMGKGMQEGNSWLSRSWSKRCKPAVHEYGVAGGGRTEVGGRGTHRMGGGGVGGVLGGGWRGVLEVKKWRHIQCVS